jgi:DNA modification methylase
MRTLPDGCAQLIIADPPYNLGPRFGLEKEWVRDEKWLPWCREWLDESKRVLRSDGNLFVYGIHHYLCYLHVYLYDIGMKYRRQIIWNYENGFTSYKRSLATHYEPLLWFSKSDDYFFKELREPYKSQERLKNRITKNGKTWTPNPEGRIAGDVWRFPTLAGRRFRDEKVNHPTQKPLSLTNRIIQSFSEPGSLVVVPFAGSGTECVAAAMNLRRYWGSELNSEYVEIGRLRLDRLQHPSE